MQQGHSAPGRQALAHHSHIISLQILVAPLKIRFVISFKIIGGLGCCLVKEEAEHLLHSSKYNFFYCPLSYYILLILDNSQQTVLYEASDN